jgi:hypothetical protein
MGEPRYVPFKEYAGFIVRGTTAVPKPKPDATHMRVAAWLTAQMEGAKFGTVQSYDGAGMSGGLLHHIAVQPKGLAQGSLFPLLAEIRAAAPVAFMPIQTAFHARGWALAVDGELRTAAGVLVPGALIRSAFNGAADGKTPPRGPEHESAKTWALQFSTLLSDPSTFAAQIDYAVKWLIEGRTATEKSVYERFAVNFDSLLTLRRSELPALLDCAMCVYHSFSANGPAPAASALTLALRADGADAFSRALIRGLGLSDFGKWHDSPTVGNRYDATREAVWGSGLWPDSMTRALMPKDL